MYKRAAALGVALALSSASALADVKVGIIISGSGPLASLGIPFKNIDVDLWRTGFIPVVRLHEIELYSLISHVDDPDARHDGLPEPGRPEAGPAGTVDHTQPFPL